MSDHNRAHRLSINGGIRLTCCIAQDVVPTVGIFGVPLDVSIKYANVAISQIDDNGQSYLYGYVPIIVAKCGVFLKEKGRSHQQITYLR